MTTSSTHVNNDMCLLICQEVPLIIIGLKKFHAYELFSGQARSIGLGQAFV